MAIRSGRMDPRPYDRWATEQLEEALADTPVVAVNGARQVGKSTLVGEVAARRRGSVRAVTLDDPTQLEAALADPVAFIEHDGLVIIDEVQRAPGLLPVIKATVDRDRRPGRFLLTGSTRLLSLGEMSESLAGRVEIVDLWPLSQGELGRRREGFLDALTAWSPRLHHTSDESPDGYLERMCDGGFPEPLTRSGRRRSAWFDNYATTVLERMVVDTVGLERLDALPLLLRLCAARTSNELNIAAVARDANLPERTTSTYLAHLRRVFLVQLLPAWSTNLTSKVAHRPKVFISDTGLAAHLLGVDPSSLDAPGSPVGALLETFVTAELRKQQTWARTAVGLYHFRDRGGSEVDLVVEARDGRVAAIEVKAGRTVTGGDFKGLRMLRDRLGERFAGGVVLHRGRETVPFGPDLLAVPVSALWEIPAEG